MPITPRESPRVDAAARNVPPSTASAAEQLRLHEISQSLRRIRTLGNTQIAAYRELLSEKFHEDVGADLQEWFDERLRQYRFFLQKKAPPDREMAAIVMLAGFTTESKKALLQDEKYDPALIPEVKHEQEVVSGIVEEWAATEKARLYQHVTVNNPHCLDDLEVSLRGDHKIFLVPPEEISLVRTGLMDINEGRIPDRRCLGMVNLVIQGLCRSGELSMATILHKMSDPETAVREKDALVQDLELFNRALRTLQLLRRQLEAKVYTNAAADPGARARVDGLREKISAVTPLIRSSHFSTPTPGPVRIPRPEMASRSASRPVEEASLSGVEADLSENGLLARTLLRAKTPEECKKVVTPEMRRMGLQDFLYQLDQRIETGKRLFSGARPTILGLSNVGLALYGAMQGSKGGILQRFIAANTGRAEDLATISRMHPLDFAKVAFNYDLTKDSRAGDLRKYTSLFRGRE